MLVILIHCILTPKQDSWPRERNGGLILAATAFWSTHNFCGRHKDPGIQTLDILVELKTGNKFVNSLVIKGELNF